MEIESIPKRGRKEGVIYSETRHGKLRVPSPPAQHTLVYGAAPVRSGVRSV